MRGDRRDFCRIERLQSVVKHFGRNALVRDARIVDDLRADALLFKKRDGFIAERAFVSALEPGAVVNDEGAVKSRLRVPRRTGARLQCTAQQRAPVPPEGGVENRVAVEAFRMMQKRVKHEKTAAGD